MNILIGGAAGQGIDTIAHFLGRNFTRAGAGVHLCKDYMSRVRGGHNFSLLRVESATPEAPLAHVDLLVALNEETYRTHSSRLTANAQIIYDAQAFTLPPAETRGVPVSLHSLARTAGGAVLASAVAAGAVLALLGEPIEEAQKLLGELYTTPLLEQNLAALSAGYLAAAPYQRSEQTLPKQTLAAERLFIDGNSAVGMAALASGCRFVSAYPMTPATGVVSYLAAKQDEYDLVVEQAEDEIAAINMVLGASFAGARSLTCTSGGGFALMAEGLSLAGVMEVPIVILLAMRPGPATGLPTRTEQGDLNFAIFGGHGEFPRAVLAATSLEDAFYRLNKAFDLADKYQMPVIFLTDQYFADSARSIPPYDFSRLVYERHLAPAELTERPYQRYRYTPDGISPRALPGQYAGEVVLADSHEHEEHGIIAEDIETRLAMTDKRLRRMEAVREEMDEPEFYGHTDAKVLLIGWGSTHGAIREAVDMLCGQEIRAAMLHFQDLWPLRLETVGTLLPKAQVSFCIENNATGQFAALLRRESGLSVQHSLLKFDGRPFTAADIVGEVNNYV